VAGSSRVSRPLNPPTSGCFRANHAAAMDPVMAMPNWMKSVTSTPQSPEVAAKKILKGADDQGGGQRPAEQDAGDLGGGEVHRGHDHAVEEQAEINGSETADEPGWFARIPELVEFEVGDHAGPAPESGVEEDRHHPREQEGPPDPVIGDAAFADEVGDQVGVSALKVVATIETPINHQGAERPEVKNSTVLEPARLASSMAGKKEMPMAGADDHPIQCGQMHGNGWVGGAKYR
jgi:hypothetical protein